MKLKDELKVLLEKDERLISEGQLLKNRIVELALKLDKDLIKLLLQNDRIKQHFFKDVDGVLIFDKEKFMKFIDNKEFLPDSYTAFKNKIGLVTDDGKYISKSEEVVLAWPFKDCVLEGGQEKTDDKRQEIFYNEILAPDEIDRLLEPKVFTNFKRIDKDGEHEVTEIKPTDNLIIKGNNLLVLHSLKKRFAGKVKLIYIDPPYNTGSDEFKYNDNFNHTTWLTFMKNRLEVAKELLSEDGAIFVQIDYHEVGYLIVLMDEIFGRKNFVQLISVKASSPAGYKTVNPGPVDVTEYILFYTKNKSLFKFKKMYVPTEYDENYDMYIVNFEESPESWKLKPLRDVIYEMNGIKIGKTPHETIKNAKEKWGEQWKIIRRELMAKFALENAERIVSIRDPHKPTKKLKHLLELSKKHKDKIFVYEKENAEDNEDGLNGYGFIINGGALSFYSNKVKEIDGRKTPTELLTDFWADISWDGIAKEGGVKLKNGKKPETLVRRIIEMATEKGDIVLDYHLGSGTTCAVAHKIGRQYIGIEQIDYGENSAFVRLKNVINGDTSGISKAVNWQGGGEFVYMELMKLNEVFIERIQRAKATDEILNIWEDMKHYGFLSYRIDPVLFDKNIEDFKKLTVEEQKKLLIEMLDKNELYVNYSEIDDARYNVSEKDKELNRKFYGG